ncbi:putative SP-containing protein [Vairimorpha necatrix]|uniref:SP-containing protein n=1 Tax=Vairimorpha necatrix TaxID=6039 RepID=A0AAX4JCN1_9MICR
MNLVYLLTLGVYRSNVRCERKTIENHDSNEFNCNLSFVLILIKDLTYYNNNHSLSILKIKSYKNLKSKRQDSSTQKSSSDLTSIIKSLKIKLYNDAGKWYLNQTVQKLKKKNISMIKDQKSLQEIYNFLQTFEEYILKVKEYSIDFLRFFNELKDEKNHNFDHNSLQDLQKVCNYVVEQNDHIKSLSNCVKILQNALIDKNIHNK